MRVLLNGHRLTAGQPVTLWQNRLTGSLSESPFWMLRGTLYRGLSFRVTIHPPDLLEIDPPPPKGCKVTAIYEIDDFGVKGLLTRHDWRF